MAADLKTILVLLEKAISLEEAIAAEIRKEKNAKKRKKLFMAAEKHDLDAIRDLMFD